MKLASVFTDHMVLQRGCPIALFGEGVGHGTAAIGDSVTEFDADGTFLTYLPAMTAGGPYDLTVTIGYVKTGLVTENAGKYMKKLVCADIGIVLLKEEGQITEENAPSWLDMEIIHAVL